MYIKAKDELGKIIRAASSLSLTTDSWTSITNESYIAVTLHILNDWTLQSYILTADTAFCHSHTAENLREMLNEVLDRWNLSSRLSKIYITTDNAANICKAVTGDGCNPSLQQLGVSLIPSTWLCNVG